VYRKFIKIWTCGFEVCEWTDQQTDRQTDTLVAILRTPIVGKVTNHKKTKGAR